jgi:hypothetical protein
VGRLGRPLRVLAEDIAGLDGTIELVAADPGGRVVAVLLGGEGEDLELVAHGLAQRAWLAPRIGDWLKLAPELDIRPREGVDLLLVAPDFGARARAAAGAADPEGIALARFRFAAVGKEPARILLETLPPPRVPDERPRAPATPRSAFRTGLSEADLGLAVLPVSDRG